MFWKCPKCESDNFDHQVVCSQCAFVRPLTTPERNNETVRCTGGGLQRLPGALPLFQKGKVFEGDRRVEVLDVSWDPEQQKYLYDLAVTTTEEDILRLVNLP